MSVQLKDVLEQRKAELTASYERLIQQISATRKEVRSHDLPQFVCCYVVC